MKGRKPTLLDVAGSAGISRATASAVLGGRSEAMRISVRTQERVRRAAGRLGYRVNLHARRLRSGRTWTIGVLVAHLGDVWYGMLTNALDVALSRAGYAMLLATAENRPGRYGACLDLLEANGVDGVIFVGGALPVRQLAEELDELPALWIPGDTGYAKIPAVGIDFRDATRMLVEHLVELGHRRFGYVGFSLRQADSRLRLAGLRGALEAHGLSIDREAVQLARSVAGLGSTRGGYTATRAVLARRGDLTAVLAFDDNTALGAIQAAAELGLKVPADVSIVGLDDTPYAALATPALTTIRYPMRKVAGLAVKTVVGLIDGDTPPTEDERFVRGKLIVRSSTAPPRARRRRRT